ncbi:uncharacterized protein LOC134015846 [Osmerus eperlanus]|uniref:uncharacterized protein LOC134015846 n=1 Tax=Osmerus eperlanus TaxID=29151 RepID=UPI002E12F6BA
MKMGYQRRDKTTRREVGKSVYENVVPGNRTLGTAEGGMSSPAEFWHPGPGCQREELVTGVTESGGVVEGLRAAPTRLFNGEPRVAAKRRGACIRSSGLQGSNTAQPERNKGHSPGHRIIMKQLPSVKTDGGHTRSTFSNGNPFERRVAPAGYAARDRRGTGSVPGTATTLSRSCWLVLVLVLGSGCHMLNAQALPYKKIHLSRTSLNVEPCITFITTTFTTAATTTFITSTFTTSSTTTFITSTFTTSSTTTFTTSTDQEEEEEGWSEKC